MTQVCDVIIFCCDVAGDLDDEAIELLRQLKLGCGFSSVLLGVQGLLSLPAAKRMAARNEIGKKVEKLNLIGEKLKAYSFDCPEDGLHLLRQASQMKKYYRGHNNRQYLLVG